MKMDGTAFHAFVLLTRMKLGGKTVLQATVRDITESKRAEEELNKHGVHLEELVEERTKELWTIINAMGGREVRMIELKEVIKQLRKQLEEAGTKPLSDDPLAGDMMAKEEVSGSYGSVSRPRSGRLSWLRRLSNSKESKIDELEKSSL